MAGWLSRLCNAAAIPRCVAVISQPGKHVLHHTLFSPLALSCLHPSILPNVAWRGVHPHPLPLPQPCTVPPSMWNQQVITHQPTCLKCQRSCYGPRAKIKGLAIHQCRARTGLCHRTFLEPRATSHARLPRPPPPGCSLVRTTGSSGQGGRPPACSRAVPCGLDWWYVVLSVWQGGRLCMQSIRAAPRLTTSITVRYRRGHICRAEGRARETKVGRERETGRETKRGGNQTMLLRGPSFLRPRPHEPRTGTYSLPSFWLAWPGANAAVQPSTPHTVADGPTVCMKQVIRVGGR